MDAALALDIGGTKLMVGVVQKDGTVLAERTAPTPPESPQDIVSYVLDMAEGACWEAGGPARVMAVGVSFGGPVDHESGRVVTCHHLPGWEGYPLRKELAMSTGRVIFLSNDANAAALGEVAFGAARNRRCVLYVTVSTGVGGGIIVQGRIHSGAHHLAGEIGHIEIEPDGPLCPCGRRGCVEAIASGPAIARAAREALQSGQASALSRIPPDKLTAREVAAAASEDEVAARVMARAGRALGAAIAAAANLLDPEMAVVGGGVAQAGEALFTPLREAVKARAVPGIAESLPVVPAELGPRSALLGAAAMCFREPP